MDTGFPGNNSVKVTDFKGYRRLRHQWEVPVLYSLTSLQIATDHKTPHDYYPVVDTNTTTRKEERNKVYKCRTVTETKFRPL